MRREHRMDHPCNGSDSRHHRQASGNECSIFLDPGYPLLQQPLIIGRKRLCIAWIKHEAKVATQTVEPRLSAGRMHNGTRHRDVETKLKIFRATFIVVHVDAIISLGQAGAGGRQHRAIDNDRDRAKPAHLNIDNQSCDVDHALIDIVGQGIDKESDRPMGLDRGNDTPDVVALGREILAPVGFGSARRLRNTNREQPPPTFPA